jgi:2-dehydropantoate 2-reductase
MATASGLEGRQVEALDPDGLVWQRIGPERVIGGVIYQGAQMLEPGHIRLTSGGLLHLGEPSGAMSRGTRRNRQPSGGQRLDDQDDGSHPRRDLAEVSRQCGLQSDQRADQGADHGDHGWACGRSGEAGHDRGAHVAGRLGCPVSETVEQKMEHGRTLGNAKTSMLQDLEQGRPMEITPLTRAITLLGRMANVPTPANDILLALISQLDETMAKARATEA